MGEGRRRRGADWDGDLSRLFVVFIFNRMRNCYQIAWHFAKLDNVIGRVDRFTFHFELEL
jgi:hypothetical protein